MRTKVRSTLKRLVLDVRVDNTELKDAETYDVACVRIRICDENGNVAPFFSTPLPLTVEGPLEIIGPKSAQIFGGMGGTYVKTTGKAGKAKLTISLPEGWEHLGNVQEKVEFTIKA